MPLQEIYSSACGCLRNGWHSFAGTIPCSRHPRCSSAPAHASHLPPSSASSRHLGVPFLPKTCRRANRRQCEQRWRGDDACKLHVLSVVLGDGPINRYVNIQAHRQSHHAHAARLEGCAATVTQQGRTSLGNGEQQVGVALPRLEGRVFAPPLLLLRNAKGWKIWASRRPNFACSDKCHPLASARQVTVHVHCCIPL